MQPANEDVAASSTKSWRSRLHALQEDPFWRLVILLAEVTAVIAAIWALFLSLEQTKIANSALTDQRISSAWQLLANKDGGSTGKRYALETLVSLNSTISGLALTCETKCTYLHDLRGINLRGGSRNEPYLFENALIRYANMSDSVIERVHLRNTTLQDIDINNSVIVDSYVDYSRLRNLRGFVAFRDTKLEYVVFSGEAEPGRGGIYSFEDVEMLGVSFHDKSGSFGFSGSTVVSADMTGLDTSLFPTRGLTFYGPTNISATKFCSGPDCPFDPHALSKPWYFSDSPPTGLKDVDDMSFLSCTRENKEVTEYSVQPSYFLNVPGNQLPN